MVQRLKLTKKYIFIDRSPDPIVRIKMVVGVSCELENDSFSNSDIDLHL